MVLLRFHQYCIVVVGDLSKMYNSINLSIQDQHVHRFLWRDLNENVVPATIYYRQCRLVTAQAGLFS